MLLIDCYNVLRTTMPAMLAGLDEARLCRVLAQTRWADEGIVVVADGKPKPLSARVSPVAEVELCFSGPGQSADDVLIEMVNRHTAPRAVTVVSTDHEIRRAARRRKARAWTSDQFIHRLVDQLGQNRRRRIVGVSSKPTPEQLGEAEVDAWLKQFGYDPEAERRNRT